MLIPIAVLIRQSASEPPIEKTIALNPDTIARVEDSNEEGIVQWWADGMDRPHKTRTTVEEFAAYVNDFCLVEDEEECKPADSATA